MELVQTRSLRKRKRETSTTPTVSNDSEDDPNPRLRVRPRKQTPLFHVRLWGSDYPISSYQGSSSSGAIETPENEALRELLLASAAVVAVESDYTSFELSNFSFYRPAGALRALELVTPDVLCNQAGCEELRVDGVLSCGSRRYYIKDQPFHTLSIDGYGDSDVFGLEGRICIQTRNARRANVWYTLKTPSTEYARFYTPFMWLATFTKLFVDFLLEKDKVTLKHFRNDFYEWLRSRNTNLDKAVTSWLRRANIKDFRSTVAAHVGFLWKESYSVDHIQTSPQRHPIWSEVNPARLGMIPREPQLVKNTVVTPFVFECFREMPFAKYLKWSSMVNREVAKLASERKKNLGLTPYLEPPASSTASPGYYPRIFGEPFEIYPGDVVCVREDEVSSWKTAVGMWFAYVQAVRDGVHLDVIWLYLPSDTTMQSAHYPFQNELFFSDHCACGSKAIHADTVIGRLKVAWNVQDPYSTTDWIIRMKYRTVEDDDTFDFVNFQPEDINCPCRVSPDDFAEFCTSYAISNHVLILQNGHKYLEPAEIVQMPKFSEDDVLLKVFSRKSRVDESAAMNELVPNGELISLKWKKIVRKCKIGKFPAVNQVPTPYNRNGVGDHFYIIDKRAAPYRKADSDRLDKLKGMGIFCGGGNLDRGIEEGGGVTFHYAVDIADAAMHTYRANAFHDHTHFYNGSVNDYLAGALSGSDKIKIAKVNDIDFLAAGSPCPGFSMLTNSRLTESAMRQASMVASVASFVDLYSPEYMLLENVPSMASAPKDRPSVFAQIVATLVALGYQVQQTLMQAGNYGSCQHRHRLFIAATAPTRHAPSPPPHTHSNSSNEPFRGKRVGNTANGLRFGRQRDDWTPFPHVSAKRATADLPLIGNGQMGICPQFPDHRLQPRLNFLERRRVAAVPLFPPGMGLISAAKIGLVPPGEPLELAHTLLARHKDSNPNAYKRIRGDGLLQTITTAIVPRCVKMGTILHWQEHRPMTIMEMRRGQGFPDHEVLVGSPAQQMTIIGNSVERNVALSHGLMIRESLEKGVVDHGRLLRKKPKSVPRVLIEALQPESGYASEFTSSDGGHTE